MFRLSRNTIGKVYFIQNREIDNDPGNNLVPDDRIKSLRDVDIQDIMYPAYELTHDTINTKLCSIFDVFMGTENAVYMHEDEVMNDVLYKDIENKLSFLKYTIGNHDYTDTLMYQNPDILKRIQCSFLQKRSGDWLQILSCIDRDRMYEEQDGQRRNLKNVITYFCSSDRIPIAYSLFLGISCIRKHLSPVRYSYYRNPVDQISNSHTESMQSRYLAEYATFREKRDLLVETTEMLVSAIRRWEDFSGKLLTEMHNVSEATTVEELKKYLGYALHYLSLITTYASLLTHRDSIHIFIANPFDTRITDAMKLSIMSVIQHVKSSRRGFHEEFDIHVPIYDPKFKEFDPTRYFVESDTLRYSVVYGQVILCTLLSKKNTELQRFVRHFIEKLMIVTESDIVRTHYMLFLNRFVDAQSGGGIVPFYPTSHLEYIGKYVLDYLNSNTYWAKVLQVRSGSYQYTMAPGTMCNDLIEHMIQVHSVIPKGYLEYLELNSLVPITPGLAEFLKMRSIKKKYRRMTRRQYRYRTCRTRRHSRSHATAP